MKDVTGHGVLLAPVPALEPWVRARTAFYDPSFVSRDPAFAHAHVTILAPFPLDRLDAAARVAASTEPFDVMLKRVERFPDGLIHLAPEPVDALRALTDAARAELPEVEPYWGRIHDPSPHLTLDRESDAVSIESTRASLGAVIPCAVRVDRLLVTWWESDACRTVAAFRLGR